MPSKAAMQTFTLSPAIVAMMLMVPNAAKGIFTQSPAVQLQPNFNQNQSHTNTSASNLCCICTPTGRKCPNDYKSSDYPEWSDSDLEPEEDWGGVLQCEKGRIEKECKEKEQNEEWNKQGQKPIDDYYYPPIPQYVSYSESGMFVPTLTEMLVLAPEEREQRQEEQRKGGQED